MIFIGLILFLSGFLVGYATRDLSKKVPHQGSPCTLSPVIHEEIQDILHTEPDIKRHVKKSKRKR